MFQDVYVRGSACAVMVVVVGGKEYVLVGWEDVLGNSGMHAHNYKCINVSHG